MSIAQLCRAPGDERSFRLAVLDELRGSVGFDAYAWVLTDPVTEVGAAPIADVGDAFAELPRLIRLKYGTAVNRWTHLDTPVRSLHAATGGRLDESLLWRDLLQVHGVRDVASMVFRDRFGCWSFLDLWRTDSHFSDLEVRRLAGGVADITVALRRCAVMSFGDDEGRATEHPATRGGPVVLLLSGQLDLKDQTPDTDAFLRALVPPDAGRGPVPAAAFNVGAQLLARDEGIDDHPPMARVHLAVGQWLTLRAARIGADIAVSIEPATTGERLELLARAAGLTRREAELVERLSAGADTRDVARQMSLSAHTVQDHLKAVFAKTGAANRRQLLARIRGQ